MLNSIIAAVLVQIAVASETLLDGTPNRFIRRSNEINTLEDIDSDC
jgi:hypothetical protein